VTYPARVTIEKCEHPWIVRANFERTVPRRSRADMLTWLRDNVSRGDYFLEEEFQTTITFRFRDETAALLFKIAFHTV
jgi:hypothetical protein